MHVDIPTYALYPSTLDFSLSPRTLDYHPMALPIQLFYDTVPLKYTVTDKSWRI
jgi:hypothetical protein